MDSKWSNSEGGDRRKPSDKKISRKRKSATNKETESTTAKRRLFKEDEDQKKMIFDLPDELLVKIVSMINIGQWPSLESISRRFRDVMNISWSQIRDLRLDEFRFLKGYSSDENTRFLNTAISKFALRSPNITSISGLDTNYFTSLHRQWFRSLAKFENLVQIAFGRNEFMWESLEVFLELAACRQHLKVLDMSKVFICSLRQEEIDIQPIKLDTFIGFIDSFNVAMQYFGAASLKTLIMNKQGRHIDKLPSIIKQCPMLEKLEFGFLYSELFWLVPLFKSVASLENLTSLKIDGTTESPAMKDLIRILGQRQRISSIAITCDEEIIQEIAQNLSFVKSVDLDIQKTCSAASYIQMITQLKELETLRFRRKSGCLTNFNSRVMKSIVANLPGLKILHIENPKCASKDFDGLVDLPLKELHLKGAKLENSTIKLWAKSGMGSRLESLELTKWRGGLKRKVLAKLIKKLPRLRRLHLSNVKDKVAMAIATSCPLLIELALTDSKELSLNAVQSIIDNCGVLKILSIDDPKDWNQHALNFGKYRSVKIYWNYWLGDPVSD